MRMLRGHKGRIGYKTVEKIVVLGCPGNAAEVEDYDFRTNRTFAMVLSNRRKPLVPPQYVHPERPDHS